MSQAPKIDSFILKDLRELPLPEATAYWPQTIGWQVVGAMLLLAILYFGVKYLHHWWHNRYRREALVVVEQLETAELDHQAVELNRVLRIVSDHAYSREQVPRGLGKPFLEFLDSVAPTELNGSAGEAWQQALCLPRQRWSLTREQMDQIRSQAVAWLRLHQRAAT